MRLDPEERARVEAKAIEQLIHDRADGWPALEYVAYVATLKLTRDDKLFLKTGFIAPD